MRKTTAMIIAGVLPAFFICCFDDDDSPNIPVDEESPHAYIQSPSDGDTFSVGETITFIGMGVDDQDGIIEDEGLLWRVDQYIYLGIGDTVETGELDAGIHRVRLTVTDSDGKSDTDAIDIAIVEMQHSLVNIWPNGDGSRWRYQYTGMWWYAGASPVPLWPTPDDVPAIPTMEELEDLLRNQPIGPVTSTDLAEYGLQFAGDSTTSQGVTAQNLRESYYSPDYSAAPMTISQPGSVFLARLCAARPDLADKVREMYPHIEVDAAAGPAFPGIPSSDNAVARIREPMLVHGGIWEKTGDWIGTYGDLDQELGWMFLDSDLHMGHTFTFQLVPSLADDVFLHCKIANVLTAHTPQGSHEKSLECIYAIDYGIYEITFMSTEASSFTRTFDYGSVIYAPWIGPVYSYERIMLYPGDPPTIGIGSLEISLIEADIR